MNTISKTDIIREIAKAHGQTQDTVLASVNAFLEQINEHTKAGAAVNLHGFGKFAVKTRAARAGRNPATGEAMQIPESHSLTFKASKPRQG